MRLSCLVAGATPDSAFVVDNLLPSHTVSDLRQRAAAATGRAAATLRLFKFLEGSDIPLFDSRLAPATLAAAVEQARQHAGAAAAGSSARTPSSFISPASPVMFSMDSAAAAMAALNTALHPSSVGYLANPLESLGAEFPAKFARSRASLQVSDLVQLLIVIDEAGTNLGVVPPPSYEDVREQGQSTGGGGGVATASGFEVITLTDKGGGTVDMWPSDVVPGVGHSGALFRQEELSLRRVQAGAGAEGSSSGGGDKRLSEADARSPRQSQYSDQTFTNSTFQMQLGSPSLYGSPAGYSGGSALALNAPTALELHHAQSPRQSYISDLSAQSSSLVPDGRLSYVRPQMTYGRPSEHSDRLPMSPLSQIEEYPLEAPSGVVMHSGDPPHGQTATSASIGVEHPPLAAKNGKSLGSKAKIFAACAAILIFVIVGGIVAVVLVIKTKSNSSPNSADPATTPAATIVTSEQPTSGSATVTTSVSSEQSTSASARVTTNVGSPAWTISTSSSSTASPSPSVDYSRPFTLSWEGKSTCLDMSSDFALGVCPTTTGGANVFTRNPVTQYWELSSNNSLCVGESGSTARTSDLVEFYRIQAVPCFQVSIQSYAVVKLTVVGSAVVDTFNECLTVVSGGQGASAAMSKCISPTPLNQTWAAHNP